MIADAIEVPASIDFTVVGGGGRDGHGEILLVSGRCIVRSPGNFSDATGASAERVLQTQLDGVPALVRGVVDVIDGDLGLLVREIRLGSDDPAQQYLSVTAQFEHLGSLCQYRPEDGVGSSSAAAINVPQLDKARAMSAFFVAAGSSIRIESPTPAPIEEFEVHLAAMQDLLTFAADQPVGRIRLDAVGAGGASVRVLGRERFGLFGHAARRPVEYTARLVASHTQELITRWWSARTMLRPVTQILAGLAYQPGFVESSVISLAAAIERFGKVQYPPSTVPRLTPQQFAPMEAALSELQGLDVAQRAFVNDVKNDARRPRYEEYVNAIVNDIDANVFARSWVDAAEWREHLLWARNDIAHEGAPNSQTGHRYVTDAESRAVRDASRIVLTLAMLKYLDIPFSALELAADRLGVRYGPRHIGTSIFGRPEASSLTRRGSSPRG